MSMYSTSLPLLITELHRSAPFRWSFLFSDILGYSDEWPANTPSSFLSTAGNRLLWIWTVLLPKTIISERVFITSRNSGANPCNGQIRLGSRTLRCQAAHAASPSKVPYFLHRSLAREFATAASSHLKFLGPWTVQCLMRLCSTYSLHFGPKMCSVYSRIP